MNLIFKILCIFANAFLLISCAAPSAPDFSGSWEPLNQFDAEIKVIPKTRPYAYQAIKLDVTLSTMLERWAIDSKLDYINTCDSDFTLPTSILSLKAQTLPMGMDLVNQLYEKQGVSVVFTAVGALSLTCKPFELTFPQPLKLTPSLPRT